MKPTPPLPNLRALCAAAALGLCGCLGDVLDRGGSDDAPLAGGRTTLFTSSSKAFSTPAPTLSAADLAHHLDGDKTFEANFTTASDQVHPGLGPLFDNISCTACHQGDGRGRPPGEGEALSSMLFRISAAGTDAHGGPLPMPGYGGQLQTRALGGEAPEGDISIAYRDSTVALGGGETASLRIPTYALIHPWKPLPSEPLLSPRVAPPVFGLGLLEAVPEEDIVARVDAGDRDHDGITGKANYPYDAVTGTRRLGRFGWKANTPGLLQQSAGAFNQDMGITTPLFPAENCEGDRDACAAHAPDVDSLTLEQVTFYVRSLAVPGRRDWGSSDVKRGEKLFAQANCVACHVPTLRTGDVAGAPWLSRQTIHPYTDLLVHDMGDGLADGRPDFDADGREWRTAPLWGIGLTGVVNGHTFFLHDGRARDLLEAVLWHDGEAKASKEFVRALAPADRAALLTFLESL